jgi:hypothetical protein
MPDPFAGAWSRDPLHQRRRCRSTTLALTRPALPDRALIDGVDRRFRCPDGSVTADDLLAQAAALRADADRLLHDEGMLAAVAAVGPAFVIGSYALDLMTWPDVDVSLQLPHDRDVAAFFDVGRAIAARFVAIRMSFSNQFIRPDQPFDHGLYWGIRLLRGGREWKVDLWGYGPAAYRAHLAEFEALRARLAGADRTAILRVKDAVCRRPAYRRDVTSMDVYAAVAEHGVRSVAEFDAWWTARSTPAADAAR